ncbi:HAD family hydrolase [Paenibacillus wynnii]|uniref:HAD family hydrolase n=1 Tax=Paenibacillus wynnii TaxID=268407 RepID=UPI002793A038|nr:HAD family phosphatase [Paenibacillus wynnii]MDQ0194208.1 beta-phosphoglucomutase-like phosphatase (HAD superfamily) [Paenibacillus wynnii]
MSEKRLPGFSKRLSDLLPDFSREEAGGDGLFRRGRDGVLDILTPRDRKSDFIVFEDKTLCYVKSAMGYPAIYPLREAEFTGSADAVLMDLDGTSVHSEPFWIWIIEQTVSRLKRQTFFRFEAEDEPHVSGHSVSEHLQYCISKYCPEATVEEARRHYFEITQYEMNEIMQGRGKRDAFVPAPGLKEFLLTLKSNGIKLGLVTSGLYEKAWPELVSAFRTLNLGHPFDVYDAVITAGQSLRPGQAGTLGELAPKPHPWLYAETAKVGLGLEPGSRVVGIEDSSAGVLSIRLAGFPAFGISGGNITRSGIRPLLAGEFSSLDELLPLLSGRKRI